MMEVLLEKPKIVVISGPTASGKSALAIALAERLGGEIVNADSIQAYRGFNIGSGKSTAEECQKVPHHLLSMLNPEEEFNAGMFAALAADKIADISQRGKVPFVVGGTGLYIRSLLCGLIDVQEENPEVKRYLREEELVIRSRCGSEQEVAREFHHWLSQLDPETAMALHPHDLQRIKRALTVTLTVGGSLRNLQQQHQHRAVKYRALVIALLPERQTLYQGIEKRVDEMLSKGLVEEVRGLLSVCRSHGGTGANCKPLSSIGYQQLVTYLQENCSFEQAVEDIKRETKRLAKRQITWWRNQPAALGWNILERKLFEDCFWSGNQEQVERLQLIIKTFLEEQKTGLSTIDFMAVGAGDDTFSMVDGVVGATEEVHGRL